MSGAKPDDVDHREDDRSKNSERGDPIIEQPFEFRFKMHINTSLDLGNFGTILPDVLCEGRPVHHHLIVDVDLF